MPTARYFRLHVVNIKPSYEISSIQLFGDNARVDDLATISSGFTTDSTILDKFKNNTLDPANSNNISLLNLYTSSQYIQWTFATDTKVNAFKIGSGSSEATFLDQFIIEYSDDGLNYKIFIRLDRDKKLKFPGAWTHSSLKPLGESFPFIFSRADNSDLTKHSRSAVVNVGEDRRSLLSGNGRDYIGATTLPNGATIFHLVPCNVPVGKYYFEVHSTGFYYGVTQGYYIGIFPDNDERAIYVDPNRTRQRIGINLNGPTGLSGLTSTVGMGTVNFQTTKDYTFGVCIDLVNGELYYHNPEFSTDVKATNASLNVLVKSIIKDITSFKLVFYTYLGTQPYFGTVSFNFGQKPFVKDPPPGFSSGIGARWEEVPIERGYEKPGFNDFYSQDNTAFFNNMPLKETTVPVVSALSRSGFYIKGSVTRTPDIQYRKFNVFLIENDSLSTVAIAGVSTTGLYEFVGIPYKAYTILSVDSLNNTVSETIGPVYPLKVV